MEFTSLSLYIPLSLIIVISCTIGVVAACRGAPPGIQMVVDFLLYVVIAYEVMHYAGFADAWSGPMVFFIAILSGVVGSIEMSITRSGYRMYDNL